MKPYLTLFFVVSAPILAANVSGAEVAKAILERLEVKEYRAEECSISVTNDNNVVNVSVGYGNRVVEFDTGSTHYALTKNKKSLTVSHEEAEGESDSKGGYLYTHTLKIEETKNKKLRVTASWSKDYDAEEVESEGDEVYCVIE